MSEAVLTYKLRVITEHPESYDTQVGAGVVALRMLELIPEVGKKLDDAMPPGWSITIEGPEEEA